MLWGLDEEGKFLTNFVEKPHGVSGRLKALFFKQEEVNVKEAVLSDLKRIHDSVRTEAAALKHSDATKHEIGKKLLFLFQCDLLPGISGKILDLKGSRDGANVPHVTRSSKIMAWTFLFLMDTGMLFYIFLFALTQTGPRQNAWFQSFALWLVVEILLVSTAIVFFTHILIPSLIMKDLSQIKRRLMDNIRDFNEKVQENKAGANAAGLVKGDQRSDVAAPFNAADYLFVSTRLAKQFPDLKEAKIISHFSTPWPRQSYLRVSNVSKKYSKKFSALTRSASILIIFFVSNFISVPPSFQDIVVQITSTTAIGYILYIHVQLYAIFPVLVILPALLVFVLVHFIIQSSKSDAQLKLARLFPHTNKKNKVTTFTPEGAIIADEEAKNIDSDDENDSDFDSISDESGPVVALPVHAHRTRRQSIGVGLDVIQALQNRVHRAESSVGDEVSSELTMSTDSAIDENEIELLHRPAGVQYAAPRIVARGIPLLRRQSRMSNYSIDLSIPSNDECDVTGSASENDDDEGSDDESSVSSSSRSSAGGSSSESSQGDQDDEGSSMGSSDYSDSEGEAEEEGKETVGNLTAVLQGLNLPDARSLSTISNHVPMYVRSQYRASEYSSTNDDSAAESVQPPRAPVVYSAPPLSFPPILVPSEVHSDVAHAMEKHADDSGESTHNSDSNSDAESENLNAKFAAMDTGSVGQESAARVKDFYSETASSASSHSDCAILPAVPPPPVHTASHQTEIRANQDNDTAGSDGSSGSSSSDEGSADADVPVVVRRLKPFGMSLLAADRVSQRQRLPSISEYRSASDDSSETSLIADEEIKSSAPTPLMVTDLQPLVADQQNVEEGEHFDEDSSMGDNGDDIDASPVNMVDVPLDAVSDDDGSYESISSASNEHDEDANKSHNISIVPPGELVDGTVAAAESSDKEVPTSSLEALSPPSTSDVAAIINAKAAIESKVAANKVSSTAKSAGTKPSTSGAKQGGSPRSAARKNSSTTGSYAAPTRTTLVRQAEPEHNFQVKMASLLKKTPSKK